MSMNELSLHPVRVLVLGDSPDATNAVGVMLQQEPGLIVATAKARYGEGVRALHEIGPDVAILLADSLLGADAVVSMEELATARPWTGVIALSSGERYSSRDFVLAGARDCLSPPYERNTLVDSIRQVHAHESRRRERLGPRTAASDQRKSCHMIAVHGSKGGVGTTTIAVNLAVALKVLTNARVAIVDASLQIGDIGVSLNLPVNTTVVDLLARLQDVDEALLDKVMAAHSSGIRVLMGPSDVEDADSITADQMRHVLTLLAGHFDYLIVDTAATLDGVGLAVLDQSHKILLVTTPEVPALKNAGRFLQISRRLGYPSEKCLLLVNRAGSRDAVSLGEIEKSLGVKPVGTLRSAGGVFVKAVNRGEDIVASRMAKEVSDDVYTMARQLVVSEDASGPTKKNGKRKSLLGWLPKRDESNPKTHPLGAIVPGKATVVS